MGKHPGLHQQRPRPPAAKPLGVHLQVPPLLDRLWHAADRPSHESAKVRGG